MCIRDRTDAEGQAGKGQAESHAHQGHKAPMRVGQDQHALQQRKVLARVTQAADRAAELGAPHLVVGGGAKRFDGTREPDFHKLGAALDRVKALAEAADLIAAEGDFFFSERFLLPRPILQVIRSPRPTLLLVDEVLAAVAAAVISWKRPFIFLSDVKSHSNCLFG